MTDLPNPLTPADCDLRDTPVPIDMLIEFAASLFGMSAADAEFLVRSIAERNDIALSEAGHA
jgi:hypothetical protein